MPCETLQFNSPAELVLKSSKSKMLRLRFESMAEPVVAYVVLTAELAFPPSQAPCSKVGRPAAHPPRQRGALYVLDKGRTSGNVVPP